MKSNSLEVFKRIYKPYKYTFLGNACIINTTTGDFVLKEKNNKDIKKLYNYLQSRNFSSFPPLVDDNRADINVYKYIDSVSMPKEQKALDIVESISSLHNKTTFYKNVTDDDFKAIYNNLKNNINYLRNYYNDLYEKIKIKIYMSPKEYLIIRNLYKIFACLDFLDEEVDSWYKMVEGQTKKRVSIIHNNLKLDHFIKNKEDYLISWEKYRTDSPIMDIITFYKNEYLNINFELILDTYFKNVKTTLDEQKLLFIYITMPPKIDLEDNEFKACQNIRKALDYLFITEALVRPYYAKQEEKED